MNTNIIHRYKECTDVLAKKQMCVILAKHRLSYLIPFELQNEVFYSKILFYQQYEAILTSSNLSDWFGAAAKALDIASPRLPENVISIPADSKVNVSQQDNQQVVSSYKQASRAVVNGLINAGYDQTSFM